MAKRQRQRRHERRREHAKREGWKTRHSVITGAGVAASAALGMSSSAFGATLYLNVDNINDSSGAGACNDAVANDCSLRQAIAHANANAGFDYIYFPSSLTGTIALTGAAGGQIPITDGVGIYGYGYDSVSVQAAPSSRIFDINPTTPDDVVIAGLTLTGGNVTGNGAAIRNEDAYLVIANSRLSGNTASGNGGAVYEAGNDPYSGFYTYIARSSFNGNTAANGGAIYSRSQFGLIGGSTFVGNTASAAGGLGGAISSVDYGSIYDSTISGNTAAGGGGGIYVDSSIEPLYNTIVANSTGPEDVNTTLNSDTFYSLVENPGSTPISGASNITGVDPQLGALGDNGGPTPTLKPAASSPVVDQGYSGVTYDQRFFDRTVDNPVVANAPGGNGTDIGSVELTLGEGPQAAPVLPPAAQPPVTPKKKKKCKKKKKKRSAAVAKKKKCKKKKRAAPSVRRAVSRYQRGEAIIEGRHWGHGAWRLGR